MGKAMGNFTELDAYLFGQGTHYDIYKKLGAHLSVDGKKKGVRFAVWAPNAREYLSLENSMAGMRQRTRWSV